MWPDDDPRSPKRQGRLLALLSPPPAMTPGGWLPPSPAALNALSTARSAASRSPPRSHRGSSPARAPVARYVPSPLVEAAKRGDGLTVIHLLTNDPNMDTNYPDEKGVTAIAHAAAFGEAKVCSHLLARGADAGTVNDYGSTTLHFAAVGGSVETAKLLMETNLAQKGAKGIDELNKAGDTPLMTTAMHGNADLIEALVEEGAAVNPARPSSGWQAIHLAAGKGRDDVVDLLVRQLNVKVDTKGEEGDTPLMHAAGGGHVSTVQLLLELGAKVNAHNRYHATALHFAAGSGRDEVLTLLLSKGAAADAKDVASKWPSDWAHDHGHAKAVALLARSCGASSKKTGLRGVLQVA